MYILQDTKMETRVPKLSRFTNIVKLVIKASTAVKRDGQSSRTETTEDPTTRYESTYKMEPDNQISTTTVNNIMNSALLEMVSGEREDFLDSKGRGFICKRLSDDIKQRIKAEYYNSRFRIIVQVSIVQDKGTISLGSRCLWNNSTDFHTTVTIRFGDSVIVATCYMLYYE
jgi:hypothetical protein